MADATRPRYGEFPSLFRGFPLEQPVDLDDMRTWEAVVAKADRLTLRRLYPPEWYETHRPRQAEAEAVELADRLLGSTPSHPDIPGSPGQR